MKLLMLPLLSGVCFLPLVSQFNVVEKPFSANHLAHNENYKSVSEINFQEESGSGRMSSVEFKSQDYCRAELKDFEFDAHFSVISAAVYFTGANFKSVEKGFIISNSLKPVKHLMDRCLPGSIVIFDDVKVKGPDNTIRTIPGVSLSLY